MSRPGSLTAMLAVSAALGCAGAAVPAVDVPIPAGSIIQNAMGVFRQNYIPMAEMSVDAGIQSWLVSGPFDPHEVWTDGEVAQRVACAGLRRVPAEDPGKLVMDVRLVASEWNAGNQGDATRGVPLPPTPSGRIGRSRVSLQSSGQLYTAEKKYSCTLARDFAIDLVSQITGQPIARTPAHADRG